MPLQVTTSGLLTADSDVADYYNVFGAPKNTMQTILASLDAAETFIHAVF